MIRHTVLFRWTAAATAAQRERLAAELSRLPSLVPSIRSYVYGADLGVNDGNYDFGLVASFDDLAGYVAYRDNPDHRAIIRDYVVPITASRVAVQFSDPA